jgi:uncharacterized membrane protein YraQ (UPF0718 family)
MLDFVSAALAESWHLLLDSAVYVLFGILVGGLLKMFLSPSYVARHLGHGRFASVFKASLLGIPIPLCSCGVLPAAASLKKQGANNGATTAFLISTPESGVDSISITWALLDPIMTVARPVAAFLTAFVAGVGENLVNPPAKDEVMIPDMSCPVDNCCSGDDCIPEVHASHHGWFERARAGIGYAVGDLWADLAGWFVVGLLLAGVITAVVPEELMTAYLGGGILSMLLMLAVGVPLYICATASTPIAAALILKGVSPGAALVFLLVGPATNMASLSVLLGMLGRRAVAFYLAAIALVSVACGLAVDAVYSAAGINARAVVGEAAEFVPAWLRLGGAIVLIAISLKPLGRSLMGFAESAGFGRRKEKEGACGCSSGKCAS